MNTLARLVAVLNLGAVICAAAAPAVPMPEPPAQRDQRMGWFREARFGMFIHWGLYAIPGGEWKGKPVNGTGEWIMESGKIPVSEYETLLPQFNPVKYDAGEWARIAKGAGIKYIVITSKHHDGFGLWNSQLTDWCIKSTPYKRDLLKQLADACKQEGLRLCFYHSIMDWHHPDWGTRRAWHDTATGTPDMDRYTAYMKGQLKELLTGYGPIGILWFDGEWESPWTHERGVDLYNFVRGLQPEIIINNRVGKGRSGMGGMDQGNQRAGDYGTPEQEIPATGFGPGVDWESCMTMNDTWGFKKNDHNWKSTRTLVRNLIDCASKGGNYLLNVGPMPEGEIPAPSVERLREIGKWMAVNGEAIYGTTASPFKRLPWGRCTTRQAGANTTLYLHVFDWAADGRLLVPGLKNRDVTASLLAGGKSLGTTPTADGLVVTVPSSAPDAISSTVVLKIQGPVDVEEPLPKQRADGSIQLPARDARLHGEGVRYEHGENRDNIGFWMNPSDWVDWEILVTSPGAFEVTAEIAGLGASSLEVVAGKEKLAAKIPATGDYGKFQTVTLGRLAIASPGKTVIAVKPKADGWQAVNLKSLHFKQIQR